MDLLLEMTLVQPRIEEIKKYRTSNQEMIKQIEVVDMEGLQYFMSDSIQSTTHIENYVKNLKRESIELTDNLFYIEHHLFLLKSPHVSKLLETHAQWKIYIE